ncbi:hypothetical protein BDW69DRAFT_179449 [Aspergillus filifer]
MPYFESFSYPMSFSSFSTSILYDRKTVHAERQEAIETTDPARNQSGASHDPYSQDPSRFTHAVHEILAKRDVKPENKTATPEKPSNETSAGNVTVAPVVKDWRYEKASIAASSIFSAVALAAFALLGVMIVKKFKARQRRKRGGDNDSLDEARRKRESLMFSKHASAGSYMVEEQKDGKVVRVFCTSRNKPRHPIVGVPLQKISSALSFKKEASRHMEGLKDSDTGRSGSIAKQPVLVSSPLRSVVSRAAVPDNQVAESAGPAERVQSRQSIEQPVPIKPPSPLVLSPLVEVSPTPVPSPTMGPSNVHQATEADISPCNSHRKSLFRLPSITKSMSPLFKF